MPNKHRVRICKATNMDPTTLVAAFLTALFGGKGIDYLIALWRRRRTPADKKTAEYTALERADARMKALEAGYDELMEGRRADGKRIFVLENESREAKETAQMAQEQADMARAQAQREAAHSREQDEQIASLQLELAAVQKQSADMLALVSRKAGKISAALGKVRKLLVDGGIIGEIADLVGEAASEADELATSLQGK